MNATAAAIALALLSTPVSGADDPVRTGLKWLAAQQKADGSWEGRNGLAPTTITATAGLALLMEGSTPKEGAFAPHLRKAIAWLETNTGANGQLASTTPNEMNQYIPSHANALFFLACAYDADDDTDRRARLAKVLEKATAFLVERQTTRGGWGFLNPRDGSDYDDSQSTATALQALLAVRKAGIEVPKSATDKALQYLSKATNNEGGVVYTLFNGGLSGSTPGQPFYSAMAAACVFMKDGHRPEPLAKWVKNAHGTNTAQPLAYIRGGNAAYGLLLMVPHSRVAFALGENGHRKLDPEATDANLLRWSAHREKLFTLLKNTQAKDGSWADVSYGPAYPTALALIVLQLDNGFLPAFAR